ncbi:MAG: hypothetical protein CM1200mP2_07290 [Planctomycetaceae bacterium]|nr:MAG: hypothetical protein CM1200mP2_07290 [Planctomycetaceae bacterium]
MWVKVCGIRDQPAAIALANLPMGTARMRWV